MCANGVDCWLLVYKFGLLVAVARFAFSIMKRFLPEEKVEGIKSLSLTADGMGAVFDVPADDVNLFLEGMLNSAQQLFYLQKDRIMLADFYYSSVIHLVGELLETVLYCGPDI